MMNIIEEAIIYATIMHQGKVRRFEDTPYILHPLEVAQILATLTDDEEIITAGILHDVVFASKHSRYEQVTKKENFDILPRKIKNELSNYLWKDVFRQIYDYYDLLKEDKYSNTLLCKLSYYFIFKYYHAKEVIYPITRQNCDSGIIRKIKKACGIDFPFAMHSLRKTFGYQYIKNGGNPLTLMKMYNHDEVGTTMYYVMWDTDDAEKTREATFIGKKH